MKNFTKFTKLIPKALLCSAALLGLQAQANGTEMICELGQRMAMTGDQKRDNAIDLHWRGRTYFMERVYTSTGADRFENNANGLVWIGIPAKGMLLDSRRGTQLANDCKTAAQHR